MHFHFPWITSRWAGSLLKSRSKEKRAHFRAGLGHDDISKPSETARLSPRVNVTVVPLSVSVRRGRKRTFEAGRLHTADPRGCRQTHSVWGWEHWSISAFFFFFFLARLQKKKTSEQNITGATSLFKEPAGKNSVLAACAGSTILLLLFQCCQCPRDVRFSHMTNAANQSLQRSHSSWCVRRFLDQKRSFFWTEKSLQCKTKGGSFSSFWSLKIVSSSHLKIAFRSCF